MSNIHSMYSKTTMPTPPPKPSKWELLNNYLVPRLRKFIQHPIVDRLVIFFIMFSIVLLFLENFLPKGKYPIVELGNDILTAIFSVELVLRFFSFRSKVRFFHDYWYDIIAVLAPLMRPLRILRVIRLLRFLRAGKWLRLHPYTSVITILGFTFVTSGAIAFRLIEPGNKEIRSFADALWWSLFTLVGGEPLTGDPAKTFSGRLISLILVIIGLILFAVVIGVVADLVIQKRSIVWERFKSMYIGEYSNHIVICGWNRCTNRLVSKLQVSPEYENVPIVVVAEFDVPEPEKLLSTDISRDNLELITGDYTRLDILRKIRVDQAQRAIILADKCIPRSDQDRDARTILAALLIEKENPGIYTCVELLNRDNAAQLSNIHVEEFFVADDYAGSVLANAQRISGMLPMIKTLFSPEKDSQFYQIQLPEEWEGLCVRDIYGKLKEDHNAILVSLLCILTDPRTGEEYEQVPLLNPPTDHVLRPGEELILIAPSKPIFD